MSKFLYSFHSFEKNILQKLALIILVGISVSFSTLNAQSYEILFNTQNASGWFGGDNRVGFGPRHVGISQSVLIDSAITLNSFAFDFTSRFDYAENPDGFGHEVTLTLNIRDDSGVIIQTEQVVVPASYEGGWITWSNINMNVAANTTLIFSAYLVGAYDLNQYTTGNKSDADAGYLEGERYVKVGISDADMDLWAGWNVHPWDSNFWLQGTLQITPVEVEVDFSPTEYSLSQNYPNPFNPSTVITYALPEAGYVSLTVFNLLGEKVATLVNENRSAGIHSVEFNASDLTSGLYIYTLEANGFVHSQKMVLMK
jgi:hypothetical protein